MVKAMQADGLEWGEGYRPLGRQALTEIIEEQMAKAVEAHLEQLEADDAADRRNGYYQRHLLTELGDIELNVPRRERHFQSKILSSEGKRGVPNQKYAFGTSGPARLAGYWARLH
jgi:transposase-like protein